MTRVHTLTITPRNTLPLNKLSR